jgi:hypothetical protein
MQNIFKIYFILVIKLNRPDRDANIKVDFDAIDGSWRDQYLKVEKGKYRDLSTPYDFESIMV